jgi:hypothetical protein
MRSKPLILLLSICGVEFYQLSIGVMSNHSIGEAALGIQWHVIGMYALSFFTGALILRFGLRSMMAAGLVLIAAAAAIGYAGTGL